MRTAIISPHGLTGQEMTRLLESRPWAKTVSFFSTRPSGAPPIVFRGKKQICPYFQKALTAKERFDLVLSAAEASWAKVHLKKFAALASFIIDESSAFRMAEEVPLIIPEINGSKISSAPARLIASPNCTVAPLAMALYPLSRLAPLLRVTVASYQSASGAGRRGVEALFKQTSAWVRGHAPTKEPVFPRVLAGNLFPQIGQILKDGSTEEELKTVEELRKILGSRTLVVRSTCVRVPVARSHCLSVWADLKKPVARGDIIAAWKRMPGVTYKEPYLTPMEAAGRKEVFVGRLRTYADCVYTISFWALTDNILKGAALNVVQIADLLASLIREKHKEVAYAL